MTKKPTISDQLDASNIVQNLIDNWEAQHRNEISEGMQIALNRIYKRLIKDDERLLQPKPKQPRKPKTEPVASEPKAEYAPTVYVNPKERTGRSGRNG